MEGDVQEKLPEERTIRRESDPRPARREPTGEDFVKRVLDRFQVMADAEELQRRRSIEEVEFDGGKHWDDNLRKERDEKDRVVIEVNRTPQYLNQVANAYRMARPSIIIKPNGNGADEELAKIKQGIIRNVERRSDAESIRDDCFYSMLQKGWSYRRIAVEFESEHSFRQVLRLKAFYDDFCVYCDPASSERDKTDAADWIITHDLAVDDYVEAHGDSYLAQMIVDRGWRDVEANWLERTKAYSLIETSTYSNPIKQWIGKSTVRVAEYFYKDRTRDKLYMLADDPYGDGKFEDELPGKDKDGKLIGVAYLEGEPIFRWSYRTKIMWALVDAYGVLEGNEEKTAGREYVPGVKYFPIIVATAKRIMVDKKFIWVGMVRDAMEPCLASDYWLSAITEMVALGPKAPWVVAYEAISQYREMWDDSNIENYAALYYDAYDSEGNALPAPVRNFGEPPIKAMTFILNFADEDIKRVMGIYQRSLGAEGPEHSGVAIQSVQREADIANFNYPDNFKRSTELEAKVYLDYMPHVMNAPQVIDIVRPDGEQEKIEINRKFTRDGRAKEYKMNIGDYDVEVEIGPSMSTRREAAAAGINDFIKADPASAPFVGDLLARNLDFPDKAELEDRLKQRAAAAGVKFDQESPQDADIPDQFKQQYRAQAAQLEQLTKQLQEIMHQIETKSIEFEHQRQIEAMKIASAERIASMNAEKELAKAAMADKSKADLEIMKAAIAQVQQDVDAFRQAGPVEYNFDEQSGQLQEAGAAR